MSQDCSELLGDLQRLIHFFSFSTISPQLLKLLSYKWDKFSV